MLRVNQRALSWVPVALRIAKGLAEDDDTENGALVNVEPTAKTPAGKYRLPAKDIPDVFDSFVLAQLLAPTALLAARIETYVLTLDTEVCVLLLAAAAYERARP